jgi:hypothetical protein
MMDDDECGAVGGMTGKGSRITCRKPATVPRCPPQIPHHVIRAGTWAAAVGNQRLTDWPTDRLSDGDAVDVVNTLPWKQKQRGQRSEWRCSSFEARKAQLSMLLIMKVWRYSATILDLETNIGESTLLVAESYFEEDQNCLWGYRISESTSQPPSSKSFLTYHS